jgi:hypothetical protein
MAEYTGTHRGSQAPQEYTLDLQDRRVRLSEQREARFQRAEERRNRGRPRTRPSPASAARAVTQRSGEYSGKGVLTAELMIGFVLVAIKLVAHFEIQEDGSVKGKVVMPQGQYGPIAVLVGLIGVFFFLSLLALGGGTRAKLAVIFGGIVITALGVNTYGDIATIATTFGNIGQVSVPQAAGVLPDIFEGTATPGPATTPAGAATGSAANPIGIGTNTGTLPSGGSSAGGTSLGAAERALNQPNKLSVPADVENFFKATGDGIAAYAENFGGNIKNDFNDAVNSFKGFFGGLLWQR